MTQVSGETGSAKGLSDCSLWGGLQAELLFWTGGLRTRGPSGLVRLGPPPNPIRNRWDTVGARGVSTSQVGLLYPLPAKDPWNSAHKP